MAEKVTYKELRNAVVHVDNSVDVSKTYEIAADVRLQVQLTPKKLNEMNIYTTQDERQLSADYGKYLTQAIDGLEDKQRVLCKIVHLPLSENTGDWQEIGEDRAAEIRAAKAAAAGNVAELARQVTQLGEQTAAAQQAAQQAQQTAEEAAQGAQQNASQARITAMLINTYALSDEQALAVKDLYPTYRTWFLRRINTTRRTACCTSASKGQSPDTQTT